MHTRPPSAEPSGSSDREGAYNVRSVPVRLYLPDGPVIQDLAPPLLEDGMSFRSISCTDTDCNYTGTPHTLSHYLSIHVPLLFPPRPPAPPPSRTNPNPQPPPVPQLACVLIQGVVTPLESEMAWLGACMAGADGWVNVCVGINNG